MDIFAPYLKINGCFIVLNTAPQVKTIKIFQYPILYGQTRDLLQIPGVAESDIRASLLKGELQHKILAKDIVIVCSDVDLLQFNSNQLSFLQNAGIENGLQVSGGQSSPYRLSLDNMLLGNTNGSNKIFTTLENFIINSNCNIVVYRNGVRQVFNMDYTIVESGGPGTGYNTVVFTQAPFLGDELSSDYYVPNT